MTTADDLSESSRPYRPLLISIPPQFAESILVATTTVAVRRTRVCAPVGTPIVLYASAPTKAVVGLADLRQQDTDLPEIIWRRYQHRIALQRDDFDAHLAGAQRVTALTLANPQQLTQPYTLATLRNEAPFNPPPNYRYLQPADPPSLGQLVSADRRVPRHPMRTLTRATIQAEATELPL